jgi:hypothetical protein
MLWGHFASPRTIIVGKWENSFDSWSTTLILSIGYLFVVTADLCLAMVSVV